MVRGLDPIYDDNSRLLILGSLPSIKSLEKQEYYGNKLNHFWRLISYAFEGKEISFNDYNEKKSFLMKHHIALWDIIKSAERKGSLDSSIKKESYNDIYEFINKHNIKKVFVNGIKAESSLKKYMKDKKVIIDYKRLLSSSSANSRYTLEEKENEWKKAINIINKNTN